MKEISNNLLIALLVVAIVISGFGILTIYNYIANQPTEIMGAATGTGKVNLSITESVEITLLRNESLFGSGYTNSAGDGILYIATNASDNCGTAGATCFYNGSEGNGTDYGNGPTYVYPFVAQIGGNDVSTCLEVEATSDANFIGGTSPSFKFAGKNNESNSCYTGLQSAWLDMTTGYQTVCQETNHTDTNDEVRIHWQLGIPEDAAGDKSNVITVCVSGDCTC